MGQWWETPPYFSFKNELSFKISDNLLSEPTGNGGKRLILFPNEVECGG